MSRPQRPAPRELTVIASRRITPHMLRLTLGGPGLAGFPAGSAGGYIKLQVRVAGQDRPVVRTYTIRAQRADEIDVDFALHGVDAGTAGPATAWAVQARPGDTIMIGGPGPAKPLAAGASDYLVVGDMTALPAIAVNLGDLPATAKGHVLIEIQSDADRQDLAAPAGMEMSWLVNPEPGESAARVLAAVRNLPTPGPASYNWVASEFSTMRALRDYLRGEHGLGADRLYISSYWKHGLSEESHKIIKREDAEATGA